MVFHKGHKTAKKCVTQAVCCSMQKKGFIFRQNMKEKEKLLDSCIINKTKGNKKKNTINKRKQEEKGKFTKAISYK